MSPREQSLAGVVSLPALNNYRRFGRFGHQCLKSPQSYREAVTNSTPLSVTTSTKNGQQSGQRIGAFIDRRAIRRQLSVAIGS